MIIMTIQHRLIPGNQSSSQISSRDLRLPIADLRKADFFIVLFLSGITIYFKYPLSFCDMKPETPTTICATFTCNFPVFQICLVRSRLVSQFSISFFTTLLSADLSVHTEPAPALRAAVKTMLSCQSFALSLEVVHFSA